MNADGSRAIRLVVVALLAVGLVGMHHLVAASHHTGAHEGHAAAIALGAPTVDMSPGESRVSALAAVTAPLPEAPSGPLAVAVTCLAVLLMLVILILPGGLGRVQRLSLARAKERAKSFLARGPAPPDLACLSVLRT